MKHDCEKPRVLKNHVKIIGDALRMIELCSASKNGNTVPDDAVLNPELLWVRWCDRLEAIGIIGAIRCYQYSMEQNRILDVPGTTPRPKS